MGTYAVRVGQLNQSPYRVRSTPPSVEPPERAADLALLRAAVGDVPLRLVVGTASADPDRDGGRDGDEREDQDSSRTLDGRAGELT